MKKKDLAAVNLNDIDNKVQELEKELIKLRAQSKAGAAMDNPGKIRSIRRTIAQLETKKKSGGSRQ